MSDHSRLTGPELKEDTLRNVMSLDQEGFSQSVYRTMIDPTEGGLSEVSDDEDGGNDEFHETINEESILTMATPLCQNYDY